MADRIDIGLGPRLGDDSTDTGGFRFTGGSSIGREQYESGFVNFYNQALGLPTLEEETGIGVDAPEVGEDITFEPEQPEQREERDEPVNIFGGTTIEGTSMKDKVSFGADAYSGAGKYGKYSDYLTGEGIADRVDFLGGVLEPLVQGNFADVDFTGVGAQVTERTKEVPKEVGKSIKNLEADKMMAGAVSSMGGSFFGPLMGGILGGETVTNAFGKASYKPAGLLGFVSDAVHAKQYQDIASIRAAEIAGATDAGFAMLMGNMGITRAPGSGAYTGNLQGLSHTQIKDLEALSKGYLPQTYQFETSKKESIFGGVANVKVEESGGDFVSSNPMDGFYTSEGKFYTPGFGYSAYGLEKNKMDLASKHGLSEQEVDRVLDEARGGTRTLANSIANIKGEKQAADAQRRAGEQRAAAEAKAAADKVAEQQRLRDRILAAQNRQNNNDDDNNSGGGGTSFGVGTFSASSQYDRGFVGGFAKGGRVGLAQGGQAGASGFVGAPPSQVPEGQTVADNVNTELPEGAYVINAAAVEFAGESDVKKMLADAQKEAVRRGLVLDNQQKSDKLIDVAISHGEVVVAPHLAKIIGYDRLTKINNRGKSETRERIEENGQQLRAGGGFLQMGGDVGEDIPIEAPGMSDDVRSILQDFAKRKRQRGEIIDLIRKLPEEDALALLIITETVASKDPLESMQAVGEVVYNRARSDYKDFSTVNTVKDVITQQTRRGSGSGMFQFDGLEPTSIQRRVKEVVEGRVPGAYEKALEAAGMALEQEPDYQNYRLLRDNVLFYQKPNSGSSWMQTAKGLEHVDTHGEHQFYGHFASPEFP